MSLNLVISEERLSTYLNWSEFDKTKALALYTLNTLISGSFYPILNMTEVALRNSINSSFIDRYGFSWFLKNKIKYPGVTPPYIIKKEIGKFQRKRKINARLCGKFVANMPLHYWTNMFSHANRNLWNQLLSQNFNTDNKLNRIYVFQTLEKFKILRNRIAHYEPIINGDLISQYHELRQLVSYISESAQIWCDDICNFLDLHPKQLIITKNKVTPGLDLSPWIGRAVLE